MKSIILSISLLLFIATGCKNKSADNTSGNNTETAAANREEMLAGDVQKTWKAQRESDAQGDKDKLDRGERQERIVFYRDGKVTMTGDAESAHGTWKLDASKLALHIDDSDVIENFDVLELDKNTLRLRASDGSELKLKPE